MMSRIIVPILPSWWTSLQLNTLHGIIWTKKYPLGRTTEDPEVISDEDGFKNNTGASGTVLLSSQKMLTNETLCYLPFIGEM